MTQYKRPDETVFASGAKTGEVENFPDIARGWGVSFDQTNGIPPMEWFNALFKRNDEALRYLMQRGIAEWSATEDYPVGAHVQEGGKVWKAKVASLGKQPSVNPSEWVETALTRDALKALIQEQLGSGTLNFGQWQWSSATSGGVANGYLALNATNPADATSLMIAKSSAEGLDYSRSVALLRAGDTLCIQSRPGGTVAHRFRVTGELVDSGAYRSVPVVYVSGAGGVPASNALLQVLMTPAGGSGSGSNEKLGGDRFNFGQFKWSNTTSGRVAKNYLALNSTLPIMATMLSISLYSVDGLSNIGGALLVPGDTLYIQNNTIVYRFRVTGELTFKSGYASIPVVCVAAPYGGNNPPDNTLFSVLMTPC
ncbi:hypothetical protein QN096_20910 [Metapseudomonas otitidis]|uniref:hypothetical protein n=1 Tax=Metapseudomonas otitidis TaxID=319939 RepID=UPI0025422EFA|nr:hypothetical protein [Pseudomonas otitidis]WIF66205.1 hypothetical protein QN096_20910 [Pseudomonas otitidis]